MNWQTWSGKAATADVSSLVLDASVALAFLFPDEESASAFRLIGRVIEEGAVVPSIWAGEVCNGLLIGERRGRLQQEGLSQTLSEVLRLLDSGIAVDRPILANALPRQLGLARHHKLTVYDASYLELAIRLQLPLATFDRRLRQATFSENVPLLG